MEDLIPTMPAVPVPVKAPRARVTKGETVKKPRGRPPKGPHNSKATIKRVPTVDVEDSGGENFDIGGFTDLDSESEVEHRPPKPTPARQGK